MPNFTEITKVLVQEGEIMPNKLVAYVFLEVTLVNFNLFVHVWEKLVAVADLVEIDEVIEVEVSEVAIDQKEHL